jgi:uncharacterized membrane protein YqjE
MRPEGWRITPQDKELFSSMKENFGDIVSGLAEMMRSEVALAKTELEHELAKLNKAVPALVVAALFGVFALGLALLAGVYALSTVVSPWLAALIVSAGSALVAGLSYRFGWKRVVSMDLKPKQTMQSVKENVVWLKSRLN